MESGGDQRSSRFHLARDRLRAKAASRAQRDQRRARLHAITRLERRLERTQLIRIHASRSPLFPGRHSTPGAPVEIEKVHPLRTPLDPGGAEC